MSYLIVVCGYIQYYREINIPWKYTLLVQLIVGKWPLSDPARDREKEGNNVLKAAARHTVQSDFDGIAQYNIASEYFQISDRVCH